MAYPSLLPALGEGANEEERLEELGRGGGERLALRVALGDRSSPRRKARRAHGGGGLEAEGSCAVSLLGEGLRGDRQAARIRNPGAVAGRLRVRRGAILPGNAPPGWHRPFRQGGPDRGERVEGAMGTLMGPQRSGVGRWRAPMAGEGCREEGGEGKAGGGSC